MKEHKIEITVEELSADELPAEELQLVSAAIQATDSSNAKYSHFNVGAAVRLANGVIIKGANQENASYGLTICAERTAIFAAQVSYPEQPITAIAICAKTCASESREPVSPCGSCRQVMTEMEDRYGNEMTVLLYSTSKVYRLKSARQLLPLGFADDDMKG